MLETFIKLLERFVVAHELIAANSRKTKTVGEITVDVTTTGVETVNEALAKAKKELPVEGEDVVDTKPAKPARKTKPEPEDDLADEDDEPEEKPKRKPRQAKPKEEPAAVDLAALRAELKDIAAYIAAGESDDCAYGFDDLLDKYDVRTVPKLKDEDVEAFYAETKELVAKYYEVLE